MSLEMHSFRLEYSALGMHTSAILLLKAQGMMVPLYFTAGYEIASYATWKKLASLREARQANDINRTVFQHTQSCSPIASFVLLQCSHNGTSMHHMKQRNVMPMLYAKLLEYYTGCLPLCQLARYGCSFNGTFVVCKPEVTQPKGWTT